MRRALLAMALVAWSSVGLASPVQWTLADVLFEDAGTAAGSFIYDADTDTYAAISITITDGAQQPLATFNGLLLGGSSDAAFVPDASVPDLTGVALLQLIFQAPLSNAGGAVSLVDSALPAASSFDGTCTDSGCSRFDFSRLMVDGVVIGAPVSEVPLPAAGLLFAPAVLGLGFLRRRARFGKR